MDKQLRSRKGARQKDAKEATQQVDSRDRDPFTSALPTRSTALGSVQISQRTECKLLKNSFRGFEGSSQHMGFIDRF